jgi:hypothetical protein
MSLVSGKVAVLHKVLPTGKFTNNPYCPVSSLRHCSFVPPAVFSALTKLFITPGFHSNGRQLGSSKATPSMKLRATLK